MDKNFVQYTELAEVFQALSHPVRLCIVKSLIRNGQHNVSHMQECLELPQSTVSQHLQKLKAAKIIIGTRKGLEINYRVCNQKVIAIINSLFTEED